MKKPKVNLSKQGLSSFFLHHVEKVILGAALLGMLFLLYNGWSTEKYTQTSPKDLLASADRAHSHIVKPTSWEDIEKFRAADLDAHKRVAQGNERKLDARQYNVGAITGSPAASMSKRLDPELVAPEGLIARSVLAPIMVASNSSGNSDLDRLPVVRGSSGRGFSGEDEMDEISSDFGEDERGSQKPGSQKRGSQKRGSQTKDPYGSRVSEVMAREMVGVRSGVGRSNPNVAPVVRDFIAVNGVVNFDAQFRKYEAAFRNAVAYYPLRDRPRYLYMEVQRKIAGSEKWEDISERLGIAETRYGTESPEVIDADYYNSVTVRPVPPLAVTDIRDIARHPGVPLRKMVPDSFAKRNEAGPKEEFDFSEGSLGAQSGSGSREFMGMKDGMMDDGMMDDGMMDGKNEAMMMGTDRTQYNNIDPFRAPKAEKKLVRFFDLTAKPGKTYQYRVRLWLNDPNDPAGFNKEAGANGGGAFANRFAGDEMDGEMVGSAVGREGKDGEEQLENLAAYTFKMVSSSFQDPEVRNRVRAKSEAMKVPQFNVPDSPAWKFRQEQLAQVLGSAWHTEWSEPTQPVTCGGSDAKFYAGSIVQPPTLRCDTFELPREEQSANLVTSMLSRDYNTAVGSLKLVRRGEVLNYFIPKAHVMHPADGSVRLLEKSEPTPVVTNSVVVDLMGGEPVNADFKLPVNMPSEILVMQPDGSFKLQNSYTDLKSYRHALLLEDEEGSFGEVPEEKFENEDGFDDDDELDDF